jgi:hypothetical protein
MMFMPKTVTLRLRGESERFVEYLEKEGISPADAVARGLWALQLIDQGRVAVLTADARHWGNFEQIVESILAVQPKAAPELAGQQAQPMAVKPGIKTVSTADTDLGPKAPAGHE